MGKRGAGSVYPRRNRAGETIGWIADVQFGRGGTAQRVRKLQPTEQAARQVAQELIRARDAGYSADVFGLTVMDLFERFFAAKQAGEGELRPWAASSFAHYERLALVHILPALKDRLLSELTAQDCNTVVERARHDGERRLATVPGQVRGLLRQALTWAHGERLIVSIAWLADVRRPKYQPKPRREFTSDEVARIVAVALERPDAALWLLMLERGLRVSEALALLRPNIDRAARLIRLTHNLHRGKGAPTLTGKLKTPRSHRDVPVSALHLELLDRQIATLPALREKAGEQWRERGLVFPDKHGDPRHLNPVRDAWVGILRDARVPFAPIHTTRHTAISRMLRHIPLTEVAAIVGDKPETILRTYAHAQIETARPALERLDARQG